MLMHRWCRCLLGAVAGVLLAAAPSQAQTGQTQCFGPYTLTGVAPVPTPIATPNPTPTVYPTPAGGPEKVFHYTTHQLFVTIDDAGDGTVIGSCMVAFVATGPGSMTQVIANVGAVANVPASQVPTVVAAAGGSGLTVASSPVRLLTPQLHGCMNGSVTVGWCSAVGP